MSAVTPAVASPVASPVASSVASHVLGVLCHGHPAYELGYVGWGRPGFFSQLNAIAEGVLVRLYRGERPRSAQAFYRRTALIGYGNATLVEHFRPYHCHDGDAADAAAVRPAEHMAALLAAPRQSVATTLLHLLFQPRVPSSLGRGAAAAVDGSCPAGRYAIAAHARRGDKLSEARRSEAIALPSEDALVAQVLALLKSQQPTPPGGGGSGPTPSSVLLASDDNAYAAAVAAKLERAAALRVVVPGNEHDHGTAAPFDACDAACIGPLQALMASFGCADALMLSSRSNMGSFLLSWWPGAQPTTHRAAAAELQFVDLDAKVKPRQLSRGRYFCSLMWGSRRGMCEANRTEQVLANSDAARFREWLGSYEVLPGGGR